MVIGSAGTAPTDDSVARKLTGGATAGDTGENVPNTIPAAAAGDYAIEVRDLGVRYNLRFSRKTTIRQTAANIVLRRPPERFWALRHVSLRLSHGESLAVIGPNGAG